MKHIGEILKGNMENMKTIKESILSALEGSVYGAQDVQTTTSDDIAAAEYSGKGYVSADALLIADAIRCAASDVAFAIKMHALAMNEAKRSK